MKKKEFLFLTDREKRGLLLKSIFVVLALNYFFYQSLWAFFLLFFVGVLYWRMEKKVLYQKKRGQAKEQFKELMLLAAALQKAGYSAENAFLLSYDDMKALYGKDSSICRMLRFLKAGKENHVSFAKLWKQLGEEISIPEISEFADIYEISHKRSGNMASVMEKTAAILVQKLETEKELTVLLSARRLEQKIMNGMPFLMMLYMNLTSSGYFQGLYHTISGAIIMSVCLAIYLGAYVLSVQMITIEV